MMQGMAFLVILAIVVSVASVYLGLLLKGIDRKLAARMQGRIGPPIRQPFWDVSKLMQKENIVPYDAVDWVFNLMPMVGFTSALAIMLYLPLGPIGPIFHGYGDLILIVYLFAFPSLAMAVGGFSSGSPVGAIGAQREVVVMMSYELPLALVIFGRAWLFSSEGLPGLALKTYSSNIIWGMVGAVGFIGLGMLLLAVLMIIPGELAKIPFDQPEAETELAGGVLVEYSGRNMGMFYLADAVKSLALGSLVVALFFPISIGNFFPWLAVGGNQNILWVLDSVFFFLKVFLVLFVSVTVVRVAMPRFKIDRASSFYMFTTTGIAAIGLMLIYADILMGGV